MGGGNGAKSKQARERNAAKAAAAGKKTVGGPVAPKSEKCQYQQVRGSSGPGSCFKVFMITQRADMKTHGLQAHPDWTVEDLFPQAHGKA